MSTGPTSWRLRYALVFFLVAGVYWPAGFYPFHPPPPHANHAAFADDGSLEFPARGIAYSKSVVSWQKQAVDSGQIDVALELRPATTEQQGAVIFALGNTDGHRNISIGQHRDILVLGYPSFDGVKHTRKYYYVPKVFRQTDWQSIRIKLTKSQISVFAGSDLVWEKKFSHNPFESWLANARITLGNTPEFSRPWMGSIRSAGVQIADQSYDYLDPQTLEVPEQYRRLDDRPFRGFFDTPEFDYSTGQIRDWLINFFGFFPLAALTAVLWQRRSPVRAALVVCGLTSLSIELTQILLSWRTPSVQDLVLNTAGGLAGACLAVFVVHLRKKNRDAQAAAHQTR